MAKKVELFFLVILFIASIAIRWYRLDQWLFFGFEQGRDAAIIQNIYTHHDFKLVGPKTDIAGIFHGAYYYYMLVIPSLLSHGNPLVMSFTLVVLSSTLPLIFYFFGRSVFASRTWAALLAVFAAVSYDYIIYARWLSNITPAIPLIALTFYFLWLYRQHQKSLYFVLSCFFAALASQFEIILVLQFAFVFVVLFTTKTLRFPHFKALLASLFFAGCLFIPHAIFNFRNQNIILDSVFASFHSQTSSHANLIQNTGEYINSMFTVFRTALSLPTSFWPLLVFVIVVIGLFLSREKKALSFFVIWLLMAVPIILFPDAAHLDQLYLGVGLSMLFFFVFACRALATQKLGKVPLLIVGMILLAGWWQAFGHLQKNTNVFFITIQEGLNYRDQQRALAYINADAHGQTFRFTAYTIPYLHPEGWQYLQHFFYPNQKIDDGAKLMYIAQEKQVEKFWADKWTSDFGRSKVLDVQTFGALSVTKRMIQ